MPPHYVEETTSTVKQFSQKPQEGLPSTETSTQTTVTIPLRDVTRLSKFRQRTDDEVINTKSPTKHRFISSFKKAEKLTTAKVLDTTILPTTSFHKKGNLELSI